LLTFTVPYPYPGKNYEIKSSADHCTSLPLPHIINPTGGLSCKLCNDDSCIDLPVLSNADPIVTYSIRQLKSPRVNLRCLRCKISIMRFHAVLDHSRRKLWWIEKRVIYMLYLQLLVFLVIAYLVFPQCVRQPAVLPSLSLSRNCIARHRERLHSSKKPFQNHRMRIY
jgi:hypothetical protein